MEGQSIYKRDHDAFFMRMQTFEGGDDIFFIKFLLLLEELCIKHSWMFTYLPSPTLSDPTAPMTIPESNPNYFNLNRIHVDQTEKALDAMKIFRSLLGAEPFSYVKEIVSKTNLSPRKRITTSIDVLIRSYTNNSVETGRFLDKLLANLPPITQFSEIGKLTEQILSIKKHLDQLDIFYVEKNGGSSCKLSDSTAVTTLLQKLEGAFFFTARERIQGRLTESTQNLRGHAERLAVFYSARGRTSHEARMLGDTEQEDLQLLDDQHSARLFAAVSPPAQGQRPSRFSPASPPPPPGPPPSQFGSPGFALMSPVGGFPNSPNPFLQAMGGGGGSGQQGQAFDFYTASRQIQEQAKRNRHEKEERYLRDLALLDRPPPLFSLMDAIFTLREATKVHTTSMSSSSSASSPSSSSSGQSIAFAATSQDSSLLEEVVRLKSALRAAQSHERSRSRDPSPSSYQRSSVRGRERSSSPSRTSRVDSPTRGRSREREGSFEKKHRPQDDIQLCHKFMASGSCQRGDDCRFAHPRGHRSGSPHPSARGGGGGGSEF